MPEKTDLIRYYADRAQEYEKIYLKPERQADIAALREVLADTLAGHDVLEVACGTGYWTQPIAEAARSIVATDVNPEVIEIAKAKRYPKGNVRFQLADAYDLSGVAGHFTAGFAGFWWSHIPKSALPGFLEGFHARLGAGTLVVFADNNYVEDSNRPMTRKDEEGNTYQLRTLESGVEYEVLKNFPGEGELRERLAGLAEEISIVSLTYYWCLIYRTRQG
jgi:demethylmenaquinone methyltransferase/2-methoxy-6-polyprenyl-1,4-benzoquinol methylase